MDVVDDGWRPPVAAGTHSDVLLSRCSDPGVASAIDVVVCWMDGWMGERGSERARKETCSGEMSSWGESKGRNGKTERVPFGAWPFFLDLPMRPCGDLGRRRTVRAACADSRTHFPCGALYISVSWRPCEVHGPGTPRRNSGLRPRYRPFGASIPLDRCEVEAPEWSPLFKDRPTDGCTSKSVLPMHVASGFSPTSMLPGILTGRLSARCDTTTW